MKRGLTNRREPRGNAAIHLTTERLVMRLPRQEDAGAIVAFHKHNRKHFEANCPSRPPEYFTEDYWQRRAERAQSEYRRGTGCQLFIFHRDAILRPIGTVNFFGIVRADFQAANLGYALDQEFMGQGLMTEALQGGIQSMFQDHHLHRIMAQYCPDNTRSAQLLKKLGFEIEGLAKDYVRIAGRWVDHYLTSLINPRWGERLG